ncbi:glycosyltransferase family 4 protein [Cognatishimia sp. SS12]|uniref:glycosyltransferase family 4 protein n=1 Tax=Cognatishimia sp. SS12 TaxID=2979465 RepID=UPI00232D9632|nr:glycosyltransferase family 4 protein [Cognatishimia sp. SS12]MDC0739206.1 glycosyltransferase family 4 protein [Cognatishimia sp. SS12]
MTPTPSQRRLRVLVLAEAANPEWVSVPLVGWTLAQALREVANVHLVTQVRNPDAILRAGLTEGEDFTVIDTETTAAFAYKLAERLRMGKNRGWTTVRLIESLVYPFFERKVWQKFGARIKAGEFDIVHRVTPLTPTANSLIAGKCKRAGVPFVMGPLNGGVPWPRDFRGAQLREREFLSFVRAAFKLNPARGRTLKNAQAIIAGSQQTRSEIPARYQDKTFFVPEIAIDPSRFDGSNAPYGDGPLRSCFIGRLVPYKGADMLIEAAVPLLADGKLALDILGDGPELPALKAQAAAAGVSDAIRFHGWVDHAKVQDIAKGAQLFTFPSIREFGGGVVLEAMSLGLVPVICDYAGPAELVSDHTGYKIAMGPRDRIVQALRQKLTEICADPTQLTAKSQAARQSVQEHFTWSAKAQQISQIYRWVLEGIPKPEPMSGHQASLSRAIAQRLRASRDLKPN